MTSHEKSLLPTHTYSHTLIAHYQHCIAEEEKAISGLEKRINEAESKINSQRKEMGGYVELLTMWYGAHS